MKTVLLTGGRGFIGKNLKRILANDYALVCPTSAEVNLCDAAAASACLTAHPADYIIHCASVGGVRGQQDATDTVKKNRAMLDNLLAYKRPDTRVIVFGSGAMYDRSRSLERVKESEIGLYTPAEPYGLSKLQISQYTTNRDDIRCLNIFACYGYGEKSNRVPSYCIHQALKGEDIVIEKNALFDYLWIDDLGEIIRRFLIRWPVHKIINVTPTKSVTLGEIAKQVQKISGQNIRVLCKDMLNNAYTGDNSILREELPDLHFTSLEEGLTKLYHYIQNGEKFE
ncbi:NAD-dependent epimerase/dehydratase family protein [Candidatus Avelusimicrobium luingense]|uniref:NAD-dependent epimerase/dehydratase family protein n=1 Tax=Candidatus Avelusimicrobium luingense TaxID=3416211 RepID=UPI003D0A8078